MCAWWNPLTKWKRKSRKDRSVTVHNALTSPFISQFAVNVLKPHTFSRSSLSSLFHSILRSIVLCIIISSHRREPKYSPFLCLLVQYIYILNISRTPSAFYTFYPLVRFTSFIPSIPVTARIFLPYAIRLTGTYFIMQICVDGMWLVFAQRKETSKSKKRMFQKQVWHRTYHWPFSIGISDPTSYWLSFFPPPHSHFFRLIYFPFTCMNCKRTRKSYDSIDILFRTILYERTDGKTKICSKRKYSTVLGSIVIYWWWW